MCNYTIFRKLSVLPLRMKVVQYSVGAFIEKQAFNNGPQACTGRVAE